MWAVYLRFLSRCVYWTNNTNQKYMFGVGFRKFKSRSQFLKKMVGRSEVLTQKYNAARFRLIMSLYDESSVLYTLSLLNTMVCKCQTNISVAVILSDCKTVFHVMTAKLGISIPHEWWLVGRIKYKLVIKNGKKKLENIE